MKIGIVGAGFTGLAAAYDLIQEGHQVTLIESQDKPGGTASGFFAPGRSWSWPLEYHYHHVFQTDQALKQWLGELELTDNLFFQDTRTASLSNKGLAQLDSASSLLHYPYLPWIDKVRTGAVLALLKTWPWGKILESWTAEKFLKTAMGRNSWQELWEPLFYGKFKDFKDEINAAWFWARIYARSKQLGYFKQGFLGLAETISGQLRKKGVELQFKTQVQQVLSAKNGWQVETDQGLQNFDQLLYTGPAHELKKLAASALPSLFLAELDQHRYLAAMTLVLVLDQPFFDNDLYWMNINHSDWPFLAVVEHTNLISPNRYNQDHLVYIGKYLSADDSFFKQDKQKVLSSYQPYLEQLKPSFMQELQASFLFKTEMAQPIAGVNHSRILPPAATPVDNLYWAGMQHVYPYDRGINYAIQLGRETATTILNST